MASYNQSKTLNASSGGSVENVAGVYEDWTVDTSNKTFSVSDVCTSSCVLTTDVGLATDFGFEIPEGADIDGIVASVNSTISSTTNTLTAVLSNAGGSGKSSYSSSKNVTGSTSGSNTFGSPTDTWGQTWSSSYINSSDFGVGFDVAVNGDAYNAPSASLSSITLTVYFSHVFGYHGTTEITFVYSGSTQIKKVYKGTTLLHEFTTR